MHWPELVYGDIESPASNSLIILLAGNPISPITYSCQCTMQPLKKTDWKLFKEKTAFGNIDICLSKSLFLILKQIFVKENTCGKIHDISAHNKKGPSQNWPT